MDGPRSPILNWTYFYQDKSMDEVRQSSLLSMELEDVRLKALEDLKLRDLQISQLKNLLTTAIKERDEAQENCQILLFENQLIQQQQKQYSTGISSIEDDYTKTTNGLISSSDSDESIISSPNHINLKPQIEPEISLKVDKPLPEKGKFLAAVIKAGPLLQTLLLAGPLPQWRHPPPPLDSYEIPPPPVVIPSPPPTLPMPMYQDNFINCRKRGLSEGCDSSIKLKYQRIVHQL